MTIDSLYPYNANDRYITDDSKAFCDGIKVLLVNISKTVAADTEEVLFGDLNAAVPELIFKKLLFKACEAGKSCYIWVVLTPESAVLDPRFLNNALHIREVVEEHAKKHWSPGPTVDWQIELGKLDVALDIQGSFLPEHAGGPDAFGRLKDQLQLAIGDIFGDPGGARNFLARAPLHGLKVLVGHNRLPTCYQYLIKSRGQPLLNVKVYDKVLDLISREATFPIGSRTNEVLGAKPVPNLLNKKVGSAKDTGMTRIEVGIFAHGACPGFGKEVQAVWSQRVNAALLYIADKALNDKAGLEMWHRRLNVPRLVGGLSYVDKSVLILGRHSTWLVNAKAVKGGQFVGTRLNVGLTKKGKNKDSWGRIKTFCLRYAPINCTVQVYCLGSD